MLNWDLVTPSKKAMATFVVIANMVGINLLVAYLCYTFCGSGFNPILRFVLTFLCSAFGFYYGLSEGMLHGTRKN